jgi:hypothetical protein
MGGVYNYVNLHVYHYAGNNPVKYTDPDGNQTVDTIQGGRAGSISSEGSFVDLFNYWNALNEKFEYSKSLSGILNNIFTTGSNLNGITTALANSFEYSSAFSKLASVMKSVSKISNVGSVLMMFMPDNIGAAKDNLDRIITPILVEMTNGSISGTDVKIINRVERTYRREQWTYPTGSYVSTVVTDTAYMDVYVKGQYAGTIEMSKNEDWRIGYQEVEQLR